MPEPEQLVEKIKLNDEQLKKLLIWLAYEIKTAEEARSAQEKQWKQWIDAYEAKPKKKRKNFPWPNASNVVITVIGEHLDTIYARIMGIQHGSQDLWMVKPAPGAEGVTYKDAKNIQRALQYRQVNYFDMYGVDSDAIFECLQLGTAWYKIPWAYDEGKIWTYEEATTFKKAKFVKEDMLFYEGPKPQHIPNWDILVPIDAVEEQSCRWIDHIFHYSKSDLTKKWKNKMWGKSTWDKSVVELLIKHLEQSPTEGEEKKEVDRGREGTWPYRVKLHEIWADYDIDGDGIDEKCVFRYHYETNTLIDARYYYYKHYRRPFSRIVYAKRANSIYGVGIPELLTGYQDEITTMHNQRIDNATIANIRCMIGRRGIVKPGENIYPGKFISADNPDRDVKPFQLGEVYPSSESAERVAQTYAEKRSGVSEYAMGRESETIRSRATATGTLALIQEGNKRFDLGMRNIRKGSSEVGMQCLELYQQFKPNDGMIYIDTEGQKAFARIPKEYVRSKLKIETVTSSSSFNQDVERERSMALYQLVDAFNERILKMSQFVFNPQVPPEMKKTVQEMIRKSRDVFERVIEGINIKDADSYIPELKELIGEGEPGEEGIPGGFGGFGESAGMETVPGGPEQPLLGAIGEGAPFRR